MMGNTIKDENRSAIWQIAYRFTKSIYGEEQIGNLFYRGEQFGKLFYEGD